MKSSPAEKRGGAFTLIELMAAVTVVAILALFVLPGFFAPGGVAQRANCTNNLKQIGLAFRTWSGDNNDLFPMRFYTNASGAMLFADAQNLFRSFQVMSNELNNPKVLVCPQDTKRTAARDFATKFNGSRISYFICLDADEIHPTRLLSGDRNLVNGRQALNGILDVTTNQTLSWTKERHAGSGNLLYSDGGVYQVTAKGLQAALAQTGLATNRLGMP